MKKCIKNIGESNKLKCITTSLSDSTGEQLCSHIPHSSSWVGIVRGAKMIQIQEQIEIQMQVQIVMTEYFLIHMFWHTCQKLVGISHSVLSENVSKPEVKISTSCNTTRLWASFGEDHWIVSQACAREECPKGNLNNKHG